MNKPQAATRQFPRPSPLSLKILTHHTYRKAHHCTGEEMPRDLGQLNQLEATPADH